MFSRSVIRFWVVFLFLCSSFSLASDSKKRTQQVEEIVSTYSGMIEFVLKHSLHSKNVPDKAKRNLDLEFSKILNERFNDEELEKISSVVKKLGAKDLVRMTQVVMQAFTDAFRNGDKIKDIELKIAPTYDAYLDQIFAEKQFDEKFKTIFFSTQAKKKGTEKDENLTEKANQFVVRVKKHVKKVISENFTEDQYRTYFEFERSPLGKRFSVGFQESAVKAVKGGV